ncbi:MAG: PQQ-like beta-propeller repeat protein [Candidatus Riflebacteria bacterium]|nr:PQQ-like beta-propeller repeat protein [Candidatus Riflebacteria bacterium]
MALGMILLAACLWADPLGRLFTGAFDRALAARSPTSAPVEQDPLAVLDPGSQPPEQVRLVCHRVLSEPPGNHHDAYVMLDQVADETTVPVLIGSLKWLTRDVCTESHCLDLLRYLCNVDLGDDHDTWRHWWEQNRHNTRRDWLLAGFGRAGLPASTPPDPPFVVALLKTACDKRPFLARNSPAFLASSVPLPTLATVVRQHLRSADTDVKRGVALILRRVELPGRLDLLRQLWQDRSPGVASTALTVHNDVVRGQLRSGSTGPVARAWPVSGEELTWVSAPDSSRLVLGAGRKVIGFDPLSGKELWQHFCAEYTAVGSLLVEGRLLVRDGAGTVYGLDPATGRQLLTRRVPGWSQDCGLGIVPLGRGRIVVSGNRSVCAVDLTTGGLAWTVDCSPCEDAVCWCRGSVHVATTDGAPLRISAGGRVARERTRIPDVHGLVGADDGLFVTHSTRDDCWISRIDPSDHRTIWKTRAGRCWSRLRPGPVLVGDAVVVGSGDTLATLDRKTGAVRWAITREYDHGPYAAGRLVAAYARGPALELFRIETGELVWSSENVNIHGRPLAFLPGTIFTPGRGRGLLAIRTGNGR